LLSEEEEEEGRGVVVLVLVLVEEEDGEEDQRRVVAWEKEGRTCRGWACWRAAAAAAAADGRDAAAVAAAGAAGWKGAEAKEAGASGCVLRWWWGRTGTKAWLALKRNRKQQQETRKKSGRRLVGVVVVVMDPVVLVVECGVVRVEGKGGRASMTRGEEVAFSFFPLTICNRQNKLTLHSLAPPSAQAQEAKQSIGGALGSPRPLRFSSVNQACLASSSLSCTWPSKATPLLLLFLLLLFLLLLLLLLLPNHHHHHVHSTLHHNLRHHSSSSSSHRGSARPISGGAARWGREPMHGSSTQG